MTEELKPQVDETVADVKVDTAATELQVLKSRADLLGIEYHPKISLEKLRARVNAQINDEAYTEVPDDMELIEHSTRPRVLKLKPETQAERDDRLRKDATRLVRIRVTCMNPNKKDWDGEVFTVANSVVGTVRKYIPFNAEDGWHVPSILVDLLKEKQYVHHYTEKKNGAEINRHKLVKEFAIEYLDPLTEEELKDLAQRQALARSE